LVTPSEQVGALQRPPVHTLLEQSAPPPHALFAPHAAQVPPPQSTSDSAPFFVPSEQVAA
jgi:hypothetical protein